MRDIMHEVAKELNLPNDVVEKVIKAFMNFVKFRLSKVAYKDLKSFDKIKTNFSIPGFGKLVVKNKTQIRLSYEKRRIGSTES